MRIKKNTIIIALCLLSLSFSGEYIKPVSVKRNFSGALWIIRHDISTPKKIDKLLNMIEDTNIKHLFVQVRGRGDSYYSSAYEPAAFDVPAGFDPLKYLIEKTRESDLKIHAWVNVSFVLDAGKYPPRENHILSKNPEWITYDQTGRSMADYSKKELFANMAEGLFLDPAVPEVKKYIVNIVEDILNGYPVDGIHLDYVRYPYSGYNSYKNRILNEFGYHPIARDTFKKEHGIDPIDIDILEDSPGKKLFDDFRRDQITDIVKSISKVVRSKDSSIIFSAAVMPRYDRGRNVYFQDWPMWLDKNYIDLACVMSYSSDISDFKSFIEYADNTKHNDKIFMGIIVTNKTSLKKAVHQVDLSYEKNMRGYSLFSFSHDKNFIGKLSELIEYEKKIYKY